MGDPLKLKIVAISDTHNRHSKLVIPECDILIHAGDWTGMGRESEVRNFAKWINKQTQAKHTVLIPGNHELEFENNLPASLLWFKEEAPNAHLLINEQVTIEGIKIYGSPITPFFCDWAWNKWPHEIGPYWEAIPDDTQILITHGPPHDILDKTTYADGVWRADRLGCYALGHRIRKLKDLDLHFFGHIHASNGEKHVDGVSHYNCCICDEQYNPTQPITIVEYENETI
jgi:Icc-related predicted phosphoesterase